MLSRCQLRLRAIAGGSATSRRSASTSASDAAQQLLSSFEGKTTTRRQLIDGNQLQKLSLTLGRNKLYPGLDVSEDAPPNGTPLPPGYHLVYFTPNGVEAQLGRDGTDLTYNAPAPFTRRMWAGGRMEWMAGRQLCVGDQVEERTRIKAAEPKTSRDGSEMVIVSVEKEFWNDKGLALVDQRSWVYRPQVTGDLSEASEVTSKPLDFPSTIDDAQSENSDITQRNLRWSPAGLFRFSALTFNGHRIHYDDAWSQLVERHPGIVVHGPLNLINMLDFWRDTREGKNLPELREISYRATSPIYAGDRYSIRSSSGTTHGRDTELLVEKEGRLCMKGRVLDVS